MKHPHPTQMGILKKLVFAESLRYTELKPTEDLENNTFDFHLDQLIAQKFIVKHDGKYKLTNIGKEYAGRMDTEKALITNQAKVSVLLFATKEINGELYYLIYTRLKQPFYGAQGLISGKVGWGEKIIDAAERELFEESGLVGKAEIAGMRHYMVKNENTTELLDDKMMFFCIFRNPRGEIVAGDEGRYEWVAQSKINSFITKPIEDDLDILFDNLNKYNGTNLFIEEFEHVTDKF